MAVRESGPLVVTILLQFLRFLAIEDDYKGPSLVNGQVTLGFVKELIETFRNQGRLHKKFAYKVSESSLPFSGSSSYL